MGYRVAIPDAVPFGPTYQDSMTDPRAGVPVRRTEWLIDLRRAFDVLTPRERLVLRLRYLHDDQTLLSIGQRLGVTKEAIRQTEARAFKKLRPLLESYGPSSPH